MNAPEPGTPEFDRVAGALFSGQYDEMTAAEFRAEMAKQKPTRANKFGAKKAASANWPNIVFDSIAERDYADVLFFRQKAGEIRNLELQPRFRLEVNGVHICDYVADFRYEYFWKGKISLQTISGWRTSVEDVKGGPTLTPLYRVKAKLMDACHGIVVTEVE